MVAAVGRVGGNFGLGCDVEIKYLVVDVVAAAELRRVVHFALRYEVRTHRDRHGASAERGMRDVQKESGVDASRKCNGDAAHAAQRLLETNHFPVAHVRYFSISGGTVSKPISLAPPRVFGYNGCVCG